MGGEVTPMVGSYSLWADKRSLRTSDVLVFGLFFALFEYASVITAIDSDTAASTDRLGSSSRARELKLQPLQACRHMHDPIATPKLSVTFSWAETTNNLAMLVD
jgi:hypothetical protein